MTQYRITVKFRVAVRDRLIGLGNVIIKFHLVNQGQLLYNCTYIALKESRTYSIHGQESTLENNILGFQELLI